eukprot:GHVR01098901.1.p3 GENE.GHVR01098901.1~~GHVR01098901.1.p3  ORF type:complete len:136 (+),score=5.70 GHVR01098901.1:189-596(+)
MAGLLHAVRLIKCDCRFVAGIDFQRQGLGTGKTGLDFGKEIAANSQPLTCGPDIKLMQRNDMSARGVAGEGQAANLLAIISDQKLTIGARHRGLDRSFGMPVGNDVLDLRRPVKRRIGRAPGFSQPIANSRNIPG